MAALLPVVVAIGCGPGAEESSGSPVRGTEPPPRPPELPPEAVFAPRGQGPAMPAAPASGVDAVELDRAYDSAAREPARRLVYRVELRVPPGLGKLAVMVAQPAAELRIDVSRERLRAEFAGDGWPIGAGAQVRLQGDRPGVYLFDGPRGRPLPAGALSTWFEGGELGRYRPLLGLRQPPTPESPEEPGRLVCALLAEWIGIAREDVARRCERGAPLAIRLGAYRAERTADVPVELARRELRSDHVAGPAGRAAVPPARALFAPSSLEGLVPRRRLPSASPSGPPSTLTVHNLGPTRLLVIVDGLAVGVASAGATLALDGPVEGSHVVGAMRPLGLPVRRGLPVDLPGELTVRR